MITITLAKVTVTWKCDKCGATGTFETSEENLKEYWAYYAVLLEQHTANRKRKNCKFTPEKIHVLSVKKNGVELQ